MCFSKKKGYFLIALESSCVNAFFVRSDLKDKFEIINNIKYFKTPKNVSDYEFAVTKEFLLKKKLNIF